ncbi:MAG: hypothetical protein KDK37_16205 [Leptospiraceae bacterium]|nr:hypothetical protein [Leptospiraceae bacterium]
MPESSLRISDSELMRNEIPWTFKNRLGREKLSLGVQWVLALIVAIALTLGADAIVWFIREHNLKAIVPGFIYAYFWLLYYCFYYRPRLFLHVANRIELDGERLRIRNILGSTLIDGNCTDIREVTIDDSSEETIQIQMRDGSRARLDRHVEHMGHFLELLIDRASKIEAVISAPRKSDLWQEWHWQKKPDRDLIARAHWRARKNAGKRRQIHGPWVPLRMLVSGSFIAIVVGLSVEIGPAVYELAALSGLSPIAALLLLVPLTLTFGSLKSIYSVAASASVVELDGRGVVFEYNTRPRTHVYYPEILELIEKERTVCLVTKHGSHSIHFDTEKLGWLLERIASRSENLRKLDVEQMMRKEAIWGKKVNEELIQKVRARISRSSKTSDFSA